MLALTIANLKMMVRNRQTTFWALFFPLIMVAVFGLFDFNNFASSSVAALDLADNAASRQLIDSLDEAELVQLADPPASLEEGRRAVEKGDLDFLVAIPAIFGSGTVEGDGPSPTAELAAEVSMTPVTLVTGEEREERSQLIANILRRSIDTITNGQPPEEGPDQVITERIETRSAPYFDVVLLGLVGMGIMSHAIISIAVHISNYRNLSILKRMLVTPLAIWKFFAAEVVAQLVLAVIQAAVILAVGVFVFRAELVGSVIHMLPIIILGSLVFLNIGFIISAWANTPAAASGMGNVVSLPMMFFAGTFFSTSALPWLLPYVADALPLAPMITALRDIGLYGANIWEVWQQLAWLAGWLVATSLVAVRVFRFS